MWRLIERIRSWKIRRSIRLFWQRHTREERWDDSDTWSLDQTCAKFILPRLKRFRELNCGFPGHSFTEKEWNETLDKMIFGMEVFAKGLWDCDDREEEKRALEGMKLFGEHYCDLWW